MISMDSTYGFLILAVVAFLAIRGISRSINFIGSIIGFLILIEVMHMVAFSTEIGGQFPILQEIFKYDVLTALAQICAGTPAADFLIYAQNWLNAVCQMVIARAAPVLKVMIELVKNMVSTAPSA